MELSVFIYSFNLQPKLILMQNQPNEQSEDLIIPDKFTYEFFQTNRFTVSQTEQYQALCSNGFIKLYTKLCRVYWHTQNQFDHQVSDWQFHISVKHSDIRKAWNLLAALFIKMNCRSGMKVVYLKECQNIEHGKQITIYLLKIDSKFEKSRVANNFGLGVAIQHSEQYWLDLCKKIEEYLAYYGIEPNGLAEGDYRLGKYISFRNEAYVDCLGKSISPPNNQGWNPLQHEVPINLKRFQNLNQQNQIEPPFFSNGKPYLLAGGLLLTLGLALLKPKALPLFLLKK